MAAHNDTGNEGEVIASQYLERLGYNILHTNWRAGRNEVDIIAKKEDILHFIEVKTKKGKGMGLPEQRVNQAKLNRLKKAASDFLTLNPHFHHIQFDIVSVQLNQYPPDEIFFIEDVY